MLVLLPFLRMLVVLQLLVLFPVQMQSRLLLGALLPLSKPRAQTQLCCSCSFKHGHGGDAGWLLAQCLGCQLAFLGRPGDEA